MNLTAWPLVRIYAIKNLAPVPPGAQGLGAKAVRHILKAVSSSAAHAGHLAMKQNKYQKHEEGRIEGRYTTWTLYYLVAVLGCCANRQAPTLTRSIGFCVIWACISSSSSSQGGVCSLPLGALCGRVGVSCSTARLRWPPAAASSRNEP